MRVRQSFLLHAIMLISALVLSIGLVNPTPSSTLALEPCVTPSPTPSLSPSPTPTPTPDLSLIFLTEFLACPESGNEWIEILNGGEQTLEISNWQIIDALGNKKLISGSVEPHSYTSFEWTGSLLNNSSDSFTLYSSDNLVVGTGSYTSCTTGISFVYENGEWVPALDSPSEDTTLSANSIKTSTAAATLLKTNRLPNPDFSVTLLASDTALINPTVNDLTFPFRLPLLTTPTPDPVPQPDHDQSLEPQNKPTLPALSVIIGGLLHILPGSYLLYDNYLKHYI